MRRLSRLVLAVTALALWLVCMPVLAQGGDTALMGQHVILNDGDVNHGDLVLIGGEIEMLPGSIVEGDLAVIGGSARVAGEVTGLVSVIGGSLSLEKDALVHGDVVVAGTLRYLDPDAVVLGSVLEGFDSAKGLERLAGSLPRSTPNWGAGSEPPVAPAASKGAGGLGALGGIILAVALAAVAMAAVPDNVAHTRHVMVSSAPLSVGVGLLTFLACAVLIPVLIAICIGIPVAAVLGLALLVCVALGWVAAGHLVGEKALAWLKIEQSALVEAVVGVLIISILTIVPCLGSVAAVVAAAWGVGAVVLTRFGTRVDPIWSLGGAPGGAANKASATTHEPFTVDAVAPAPKGESADATEASAAPGTHPLDERLLDEIDRDAEDQLEKL